MADLLRTLQRIRASAGEPEIPLNPLIASTMVAMGEVASEAAGKKADEQAARTPPPEITLKPGPGGKPVATIKNAPIFDAEEQKAQAKATPREMVQDALKQHGHRLPRPQDAARDVAGFGGAFTAAAAEGGVGLGTALIAALVSRHGGARERFARNIANMRAANEDQVFLRKVKPLLDEEQQIDAAERRAYYQKVGEARKLIRSTDFSKLSSPEEAYEEIAAASELDEFPPFLISAIDTKRALDLKKAEESRQKSVDQRITGMKKEDVAGYDSFEAWLADQEAEKGSFTKSQASRAKGRFSGLRREVSIQNRREDRIAEKHEERGEKKIKPTKEWPVGRLVSSKGKAEIDQDAWTIAVEQKEEEIRESIRKNQAELATKREELAGLEEVEGSDSSRVRRLREETKQLSNALNWLFGDYDAILGVQGKVRKKPSAPKPNSAPAAQPSRVLSGDEALKRL